MGYAEITYKDKNSLKRLFQTQRLKVVTNHAFKNVHDKRFLQILDYGCGNAELLKYLSPRLQNFSYTGYDPWEIMIEEAKLNVQAKKELVLTANKNDLKEKKYDVIFCLEVFEHLPHQVLLDELETLNSFLSEDGILVFGVPNELYLAALIRGTFRMTRRYGAFDANFKNVFSAVIGKPPVNRRVEGDTSEYLFYHMGFDHRKFIKILKQFFTVKKVFGSPVPALPVFFNTEVYITCKKK